MCGTARHRNSLVGKRQPPSGVSGADWYSSKPGVRPVASEAANRCARRHRAHAFRPIYIVQPIRPAVRPACLRTRCTRCPHQETSRPWGVLPLLGCVRVGPAAPLQKESLPELEKGLDVVLLFHADRPFVSEPLENGRGEEGGMCGCRENVTEE